MGDPAIWRRRDGTWGGRSGPIDTELTEADHVILFGVELGLFQAWQIDVCLRVMECDDGE